jgi:hypothetical protein
MHTMDADARRCGRSRRPACLLALLAALLCGSAQAASYLGCFDVNQLRYSIVSHSKGSWSVSSCEARCRKGQHPLFGLAAQDTQCVCGSDIPNGLYQLTDANCLARTVESLALYYSHHGGWMAARCGAGRGPARRGPEPTVSPEQLATFRRPPPPQMRTWAAAWRRFPSPAPRLATTTTGPPPPARATRRWPTATRTSW